MKPGSRKSSPMERTMRSAATLGPEALDGWQCYYSCAPCRTAVCLRKPSSRQRHSSLRVDNQCSSFAVSAPPSNPCPDHAHTKKLDKPRRGLGSDANQRARIIQKSELESGRSQGLNQANCRKKSPRTVRETAAALAHLRPRRPFPVSLFYSDSIPR